MCNIWLIQSTKPEPMSPAIEVAPRYVTGLDANLMISKHTAVDRVADGGDLGAVAHGQPSQRRSWWPT
jgi:hypothetical protein